MAVRDERSRGPDYWLAFVLVCAFFCAGLLVWALVKAVLG